MLVIPAVQLSQSTEQYIWPSLAEINTRSRRLVNAYLKQQKREELRHAQLIKVRIYCIVILALINLVIILLLLRMQGFP